MENKRKSEKLKAKQMSLIVKVLSALLLVVFYVLYCVGVFSTNVDDMIKVVLTLVAIFLDISINTALDKFTGKTNEQKTESLNE